MGKCINNNTLYIINIIINNCWSLSYYWRWNHSLLRFKEMKNRKTESCPKHSPFIFYFQQINPQPWNNKSIIPPSSRKRLITVFRGTKSYFRKCCLRTCSIKKILSLTKAAKSRLHEQKKCSHWRVRKILAISISFDHGRFIVGELLIHF